MAKDGYNIVLAGRRKEALAQAAAEVQQAYPIQTRKIVVIWVRMGFWSRSRPKPPILIWGFWCQMRAMGALLKVDLSRLTQMLRLNTQTHLELVHHFGRRFTAQGRG